MIPELAPLLTHLPPRTVRALHEAIHACSRQMGMPTDWVQRWVAFTLIAGALTEPAPDGQPRFQLKGGAAIELRLRQPNSRVVPRVSKDLDATYRGELGAIQSAVEAVLSGDRQGFTFRLISVDETPRHMRRFEVAIDYRGKSFSRVKLEISVYEGAYRAPDLVPAPDLRSFGLVGPSELPVLPLAKQIAQKLHALTEAPGPGKTNDRFRDLVDVVLLSVLAPPSSELREVCEETFALRGKHDWPPTVTIPGAWVDPLEALAQSVGLQYQHAADIVFHVASYLNDIAAA